MVTVAVPASPPPPSDALRQLARRVRRLPAFGRLGPEAVAEERDEIASELRRLARLVPPPPRAVLDRPVVVPPLVQERARRLEARARAQAAETAELRRLLAAAVRRRPRRARADGRRLELGRGSFLAPAGCGWPPRVAKLGTRLCRATTTRLLCS